MHRCRDKVTVEAGAMDNRDTRKGGRQNQDRWRKEQMGYDADLADITHAENHTGEKEQWTTEIRKHEIEDSKKRREDVGLAFPKAVRPRTRMSTDQTGKM